jgi:hypothetical protein
MRSGLRRDPLGGDRATNVREIGVESVRMDIFRIFSRPFEQVMAVVACGLGYLWVFGFRALLLSFVLGVLVLRDTDTWGIGSTLFAAQVTSI